ncbi:hypothetical protein [Paenibacillus sp. RUD330]|nr:hypothetical protein [Paenibacillus sp. RUD330]
MMKYKSPGNSNANKYRSLQSLAQNACRAIFGLLAPAICALDDMR